MLIEQAWKRRSDELAQSVTELMRLASPEAASAMGLSSADAFTSDFGEGWRDRLRAAAHAARTTLRAAQAADSDPRLREDIAIMLARVDDIVGLLDVVEANLISFIDVAKLAFLGLRVLLDEQNPPERKALALVRLRRYAGFEPGVEPVAHSAEKETRTRLAIAGLTGPYDVEARTSLGVSKVLVGGIRDLLRNSGLTGWEEPFAAFEIQCEQYATFVERELLPCARSDHRLPPEVYAFALRHFGVDISPDEMATRAHAAFDEIQVEMQALAPRVAAELGIDARDYRDVIRALKRSQIHGDADAILAFYRKRLAEIEEIVRRERLVTLPNRPARIRVASLAESAELPVAHMNPAPLIGNTGQVGEFVLPLDVPPAPGRNGAERADDFTHDAVTWTLTAHEARPGHEVQFDRMLEGSLSLARAAFAFNSVNVEGWALYAEYIVLPYMPLAAQFSSLQMRLHRAARAFLDPELQSGKRTPAQAQEFLEREVVFSPTFARSEVERYTFRAPGQATSYFYGYTKLIALRAEAEAALGSAFDARAFHDFILDQGLLPPDALRSAVLERFVTAGATAAG